MQTKDYSMKPVKPPYITQFQSSSFFFDYFYLNLYNNILQKNVMADTFVEVKAINKKQP
jgi:hypothetical protein